MHLWHAEDRHDRVADELLDRASVALDDRLHLVEVAAEERAQGLRVGRLAERGRADDVAEENRHDLSVLPSGGLVGGELGPARVAETRLGRVLLTAARTSKHARSVRRSSLGPLIGG